MLKKNNRLKAKPHPLLSWDISGQSYWGRIDLSSRISDAETLLEFSRKFHWTLNWNKELLVDYEALVLTDHQKIICWANEGFTSMTGYSVDYAIGQSPGFLHGINTTEESRNRIRRKINSGLRFKDSIINYRKNGAEYLCELSIIPIPNMKGEVTHYLALESAI